MLRTYNTSFENSKRLSQLGFTPSATSIVWDGLVYERPITRTGEHYGHFTEEVIRRALPLELEVKGKTTKRLLASSWAGYTEEPYHIRITVNRYAGEKDVDLYARLLIRLLEQKLITY